MAIAKLKFEVLADKLGVYLKGYKGEAKDSENLRQYEKEGKIRIIKELETDLFGE